MPLAEPEQLAASAPPARPWTLLPTPWAIWFWNQARKIVVGVIGGTVIAIGIVMLVVPGPGVLTIFGGLAILATEFVWARWMLKFARDRAGKLMAAAQAQMGGTKFPQSSDRAADPPEN
jgi:uncharacterized protein (TIGR02611 family)